MDTQRLSQTVQPLLDWFQAHARTLPWRADRLLQCVFSCLLLGL